MAKLEELKNRILSNLDENKNLAITRAEGEELLKLSGSEIIGLMALANTVRESRQGNNINLCSIVNAKSGYCPEDCAFCAQSRFHHTKIDKYPLLSVEEILGSSLEAEKTGAEHFGIVTSGHKLTEKDFKEIVKAVQKISEKTNLRVCASLGVLSIEQLSVIKDAGLFKYHHNLETSESYFDQICTTHSYSERIDMIKRIKSLGLKVCCGGIIGLGETPSQRLELAETLAKLDVDSIPINILSPILGTKLASQPPLAPMEILKTIAIFRLMLPDKTIKLAGGREKNLRDLQPLGLTAGANGLLIGNYLTMPGQSPEKDMEMIKDLGLKAGRERPGKK
jgi:biotin synthase